MAAAYLDSQLEELLRLSFVKNDTVANEMMGRSKPLASFSARIDMSYLLGLITAQAHRDLHLIRKIRNDFGHEAKPLQFSSAAVGARCKELFHTWHKQNVPPRSKFTSAVLGVLAVIHAACHHTKRPTSPPDLLEKEKSNRAEAVVKVLEKYLKPRTGE